MITLLKTHKFSKYEVFSITPVISWEYACHAHINNPYYKIIANKTPNLVVFQNKNFQVWDEQASKIKLSDEKLINKINSDSLKYIKNNKQKVKSFINSKLDKDKAIKGMNFLNNQCLELYKTYLFYTEEYFDTNDSKLLKELPEIRIKLSKFVDLIWRAYNKIIKYIQKKLEYKIKQLERATSEEIINILKGNKIKITENRPLAITIINNQFNIYLNKEAEEIENFLVNQEPKLSEKNQISGNSAYTGFAKGQVIKITEKDYGNYKKIFKNKKDFILVAPMTRPEIVKYLKKAAAIVTDEGGITCHASIVAREMKIPCIIGTKIATKVLNDNDIVEVDADKGIIKILKKAK
ncbi:MAG: PEP-utilizing enzyme [archaeon]